MSRWKRSAGGAFFVAVLILAGGLGLVSAAACSDAGAILTTFNPCGTVFSFCSAEDIPLLFADIPDFRLDPTCTIPGFGFDPDTAGAVPSTTSGGCADQFVFNVPGNRPE